MKELLKKLPSVDDILKDSRTRLWLEDNPRVLVLEAIRSALDIRRRSILGAVDTPASLDERALSLTAILDLAGSILAELSEPSLQPVINATGVVVHTNLGRSILSEKAIECVASAARCYSNLEYDIAAGERGKRYVHVEGILMRSPVSKRPRR
jgi:L-seryl-tRNA(Ser) seleniumtransferase